MGDQQAAALIAPLQLRADPEFPSAISPEPGAAAEGGEQQVTVVCGNDSCRVDFSHSLVETVKEKFKLTGNLEFRHADAETNQTLTLTEVEQLVQSSNDNPVVLSLTLDGVIVPAVHRNTKQRKPSTLKADKKSARLLYANSCLRAQIEIMDDHIEATSGNYKQQMRREIKVGLDFKDHEYVSKVASFDMSVLGGLNPSQIPVSQYN